MKCFLPEGRNPAIRRPEGDAVSVLKQAHATGQILEGQALCCTPEHDLVVAFNGVTGIIPRCETALGIEEGTTKEIAILSRVGKDVCFTVLDLPEENGVLHPVFSRRRAQREALGYLLTLPVGSILPATVTHLEPFGAFLDVGCGVVSMLGIEHISIARISHPNQRFSPGQEIHVVLRGTEPERGRILLTHKELLGTWAENTAGFSRGMTVPGIVRGLKSYGIFVELAPNLSGLAEPQEDIKTGERVSVFIKAILPDRQKVKLLIIDRLAPAAAPAPLFYRQTEGRIAHWQYAPGFPIFP